MLNFDFFPSLLQMVGLAEQLALCQFRSQFLLTSIPSESDGEIFECPTHVVKLKILCCAALDALVSK
jgi:hypothetical protein